MSNRPQSAECASNASIDEACDFEASLYRQHPAVWWLTLLGPILIPLGMLATIALFGGWHTVRLIVATAIATFFVFGRFVILSGTDNGGYLSPEALALMVLTMDVMAASLIAFHTAAVWRLPMLGPRMQELAETGHALARWNPWVRRTTFFSICAFVMFPLAATGSIGGSLFGRILGMGRARTFFAVLIGSVLGCGLMYFGAAVINRYVDRSNPWLTVAGIVCVLAMIVVLTHRFRRLVSQASR